MSNKQKKTMSDKHKRIVRAISKFIGSLISEFLIAALITWAVANAFNFEFTWMKAIAVLLIHDYLELAFVSGIKFTVAAHDRP